jgi:hypothetical protein
MSGRQPDTVACVEDDLADELLRLLRRAVALLDRMGEDHWAAWLRSDLATLQRGDAYGLDHLLRAFGGMGSINDVALTPTNGHPISEDDAAAVNADLRALLGAIYTAATSLR